MAAARGRRFRNPKAVAWRYWQEPARREAFWTSARQNAVFLGKWLVLAFVLESLMVAYVPKDLVASVAGDGGFLSILGATLVGIPSYLNGNAALPLVAGLMAKGMAPGAAMAFLVGGGVTSIPAALAVWGVARRTVFAEPISDLQHWAPYSQGSCSRSQSADPVDRDGGLHPRRR